MHRILSILLVILFPFTLYAQDRAIVEHNGEEGYWFSKENGDRILRDLEKYKKIEELNLELELKIFKQDKKIEKLEYIIKLDNSIEKKHKEIIGNQDQQIDILNEENKELRSEQNKWYNSKILWFSAGFILSTVFCVGAVVTIRTY